MQSHFQSFTNALLFRRKRCQLIEFFNISSYFFLALSLSCSRSLNSIKWDLIAFSFVSFLLYPPPSAIASGESLTFENDTVTRSDGKKPELNTCYHRFSMAEQFGWTIAFNMNDKCHDIFYLHSMKRQSFNTELFCKHNCMFFHWFLFHFLWTEMETLSAHYFHLQILLFSNWMLLECWKAITTPKSVNSPTYMFEQNSSILHQLRKLINHIA